MALRTRKAFVITAAIVIILAVLFAGATEAIRVENGVRVARAEALIRDLQQLQVGKPGSKSEADAIVARYGSAPPPPGVGGTYSKEYCAATNHLDTCTYQLVLNNSPVLAVGDQALTRWQQKHSSMRIPRVADWWGYAMITVRKDVVVLNSFWLWFRTPQGEWQGVGEREGVTLPRFEPVDARISNSYSLQCLQPGNNMLQTSITPSATSDERQRASRFDFTCLRQKSGCRDMRDLMPDAWRDFYAMRGHFDLGRLQPGRITCGLSSN